MLDHSSIKMTEVYAERDGEQAMEYRTRRRLTAASRIANAPRSLHGMQKRTD